MGAKIRSKVKVVYDPRDQIQGTIIIELINWYYNVGSGYSAVIKDSIENDSTEDLATMASSAYPGGVIRTKTKNFTIQEVNFLYAAITEQVGDIAEGEEYTAYFNKLLSNAVLYLTKNELTKGKTVYGLLPTDWEIADEV